MRRSNRRALLRDSSLAGASLLLPQKGYCRREPRSVRTISIFHTTDLHGHIRPTQTYGGIADVGGLARCAAQIRKWRKSNPHSLLLDMGDVYQGTAVGWMTRGRLMIDLFNKLQYDAWVIGNHEFDWGPEVVLDAVSRSTMPVLTGNLKIEGKRAGTLDDPAHPLSRITPHMVKTVGGFRIGLVGLTTPGLPYWLRPELLMGFEPTDPVDTLRASLRYLREEAKVDAVVVCGHMGLREVDDFANPVRALLELEDGPDVYLAGHTHRDHPSQFENKTLYTQADYFGIHCGRVDLSFDMESRRIVEKRAQSILMDERIPEDPLVLEVASEDLQDAEGYLSGELGELEVELSGKRAEPGMPSSLQSLISSSAIHAARKEGIQADGVFHGTFGGGKVLPGKKTIADAWEILPYDNRLLVLDLNREELVGVINESMEAGGDRALFGFEVIFAKAEAPKGETGRRRFVRELRSLREAESVPRSHRYSIVFNSYDAQSGGKRLMRLRALAQNPECKPRLLQPNSREALIDFFADVGPITADSIAPHSVSWEDRK
ncbi:MAG TPA: hypothetical protein DIV39_12635 [Verrucomicrobiales bacterium]|nr:hypothetical protein [Verrucomicrobiales bacterium]